MVSESGCATATEAASKDFKREREESPFGVQLNNKKIINQYYVLYHKFNVWWSLKSKSIGRPK